MFRLDRHVDVVKDTKNRCKVSSYTGNFWPWYSLFSKIMKHFNRFNDAFVLNLFAAVKILVTHYFYNTKRSSYFLSQLSPGDNYAVYREIKSQDVVLSVSPTWGRLFISNGLLKRLIYINRNSIVKVSEFKFTCDPRSK